MSPASPIRTPRPRASIRGRTAIIVLLLGLLVLTVIIYWVIVDLKRRGPESLKVHPAPQSEPRP